MNILFTVCGRAGSKGIKNKNIKVFLGYPLPLYTFSSIDLFIKKYGQEFENISVALNTDSEELVSIVNSTNLDVIKVSREAQMATDISSKVDVIRDTLIKCSKQTGLYYDYIIDLDITSPLRTADDIYNAFQIIKSDKECDVTLSVTNPRRNPYFNMVRQDGNYYKRVIQSNFTARQQAPQLFDLNASIYVYSNEFMTREDNLAILDSNVLVSKMMDTAVLDIDSEEDFELMEVLAGYFYSRHKAYNKVKLNICKILL